MSAFVKGAILSAGLACTAVTAKAQENVMVVFDGSNSMWGQIEGVAKIEIAKGMMETLLGEWTDDRQVGLMAYGHRRRGDCGDIETLVEPGQSARDEILKQVQGISPRGKTPLTDAVEQAATALAFTDRPATVVLISDGLESCDRDPCALARALEQGGVSFTAHVVGFGLGADQDDAQLACIAEETGGTYIQAGNADELKAAMSSVSSAVAEATAEPEATPAPEPEPEAEPDPTLPEITVTGPGSAVGGSVIQVTWDPFFETGDYITVVPAGADEGTYGPYFTIQADATVPLTLPGDEGLYELRYVHAQGDVTLGRSDLEIIKPEATLSGPDTVLTGSEFSVSWQPSINPQDYVTIVPTGAAPGTYGSYVTILDKTEGTLTADADPGLYELRYVLAVDDRTVASRPIEVVDPEVTITAPATALTGSDIAISWTGAVNGQDYISIIPQGTPEGEYGNYVVVRDKTEGSLKAPADAGLYELRYTLRQGKKTLARAAIEITDPEVTVSAPENAVTGSKFMVSWTGAIDGNDYVTIVPAGAAAGTYGNYVVVRGDSEKTLQAPAETGLYEVRYVLREGNKTLASTTMEIIAPQVTVSAPETAITGERFRVSWTGAVNGNDYVTIVPAGAEEGEFGNYVVVRNETEKDLQAPSDTGLYEVRYVLREGNKTLASVQIEITGADVTLTAPDTALAGSNIPVAWTGTVSTSDYISIVPAGSPDGEYGNYFAIRNGTEGDLRAPANPGLYEVRYILREGNKTLASSPIEILEPKVTVAGPDQVRAGDRFRVTWTGAVDKGDYVALAPMGSDDDDFSNYISVRNKTEHDLTAPDEIGLYELRYILREGRRVLARQPIEVLAPDAALNSGAALDAPDSAAAGSSITVGWSTKGTSADRRITIAGADQAMFTWISAVKITGNPPVTLTLPDAPGDYELRFLDVSNKAVLARKMITVQ